MRLTDILQRNSQITEGAETARMQGNNNRSGLVNRQIQALVPGQTIQGEVVSKSGNEIQIRLADDMMLSARLDQNMGLEIGKLLSFQVKNNGQTLLLSPLFTNTAVEGNVLKALDMAFLPVNEDTVEMTQQMMEAGLPVNKNSLQQIFRELNMFPGADIRDIVDLHRLGLPVNESSINQIGAYKNFNHQLLQGMNDVMAALSDTLEELVQNGDIKGAAQLYQEMLALVSQEQPGEELSTGKEEANNPVAQGLLDTDTAGKEAGEAAKAGQKTWDMDGLLAAFREENAGERGTGKIVLTEENATTARMGERAETIKNVITEEESGEDGKKTGEASQKRDFSQMLNQLLKEENTGNKDQLALLRELFAKGIESGEKNMLRELLGNKEVRGVLSERLEALFTTSPEELEDAKSVEALYQRLDKQLKGMGRVLENAGQTDSGAYKMVQNLNQNLDFLQQVNQVYTYVQLPVRMQQGKAHGDLYVYTNKKNLAAKDGQVSALLHLDMEYLGPVDVYVMMQAQKVNTKFYVQDEEMLDFLEEHMDLLTERLKRRGYDMTAQMQVRDEKPSAEGGMGALQPLLPAEGQGNMSMLQHYAFDVRA